MQSLQDLLNHEFIITNALAEELYNDKSSAAIVRLRSRASGKHRFVESEYKALLKIGERLAKNLEKTADKLLQYKEPSSLKINLYQILRLRWLRTSQLVSHALGSESYYKQYDSLRGRTKLNAEQIQSIADTMRAFATYIRTQLKLAMQEAKQYQFSAGQGQHSHILDN